MNQYRPPRPSPYAVDPNSRAPRWPWVLLIAVLAAIAGIGGLIIAGSGLGEDDAPPQTVVAGPNGEMIIVAGSASPSLAPSPSAESAAPSAEAPAPSQEPTIAPTATPAGPTNVEVAQSWAENWQAGDFAAMYELLSDEAKATIGEDEFADRYRAIYERASITGVTATLDPDASPAASDSAAIPLATTFESTQLGRFALSVDVPLAREGGQWVVAWTPSAIFTGLDDGCVDIVDSPTSRGSIYDRNGEVLAQEQRVVQIGVYPAEVADPDLVNQRLADVLDMDAGEVAAAWEGQDPSYFIVIRSLPQADAQPILNELRVDGIQVRPSSGRVYPFGAAAAHITGYVTAVTQEDIDADPALAAGSWLGRSGLEAGADAELAGIPGATLVVVDCDSRTQRSALFDRAPVPGKDLILTIDIDLQIAVDQALDAVEGDDTRASAVVIDPRNGAVLALASRPTYDPNGFILGFSSEENAELSDETLAPLVNRATTGTYPVGSIFKVITMAAGMAHLGYDNQTVLDCPSSYEINGQIYNDWVIEWGEQPQGQLTLHDALVQSCNTVFYGIGADLDQQDPMFLPDMARAFGLGAPTDIPFLPESGGTVPDPQWKAETQGDGWATGDAINMAIGQGFLLATPLQMANAYATLANGGTLLEPFIVQYTQEPGGPATRVGERRERGQLPLEASQVEQIQQALRDQTSNANERGSARVFGPQYPFAIAGKTGTSESTSTRDGVPHSWFAAFGPWDGPGSDPSIASVVMIENIGEGGKFAAPATKAIYDYYQGTDLAAVTGSDDGSPAQPQSPRPAPTREPDAPPSSLPSSGGSPRPSSQGRRRPT